MFVDNKRQEAIQYESNFKALGRWDYSLGSLVSHRLRELSGGYVRKQGAVKNKEAKLPNEKGRPGHLGSLEVETTGPVTVLCLH